MCGLYEMTLHRNIPGVNFYGKKKGVDFTW